MRLPGMLAHRTLLAIVTIIALAASPAASAPPVAPSPEAEIAASSASVEPASLAVAVEPAAPLPLSGPSAAPRTAAPRPLPDWRLLAALGAAFAVLAGYRMLSGRRVASLPPEVFEVLGEASLGGQQTARIVRFGPRTLLVGISSAGCQTLAELTDPQATEAIVASCRGAKAGSVVGRMAERRQEPRA